MTAKAEILALPKKGTLPNEAREQERQNLAEQQAKASVQQRGDRMLEAAEAKYEQDMAAYEEAVKTGRSTPAKPQKPSIRGLKGWKRSSLRAAKHRARLSLEGAKRRREDEAGGSSSKAAPAARRKKKGGKNEAPEWSKYRREGETWKPPDPPLLRRKASSNIKYKQRRAFKRRSLNASTKLPKGY